MTHRANKRQRAAFERVVKAIRAAQQQGLVFYGKEGQLVAYTRPADDYVGQHPLRQVLGSGSVTIPYLSARVLADLGADDYPCYLTPADQPPKDRDTERTRLFIDESINSAK